VLSRGKGSYKLKPNTQSPTQKKQPNILHFFVDQMRYDCINALGNPYIKTPALNRLVTQGSTFSNAFSPSPVCIPARCSMIYGQYPHTTGCYENNFPMPTDDRKSFMDILSSNGYRTHGIGKCHFTPDPLALRGFQTRETQEELPAGPEEDDYLQYLFANGFEQVIDPHGVRGEMYYIPQVSQIPQKFHPTQWIGDRSLDFIREEHGKNSPWYLFSSFIHPHPPFAPPSPWHKMYGFNDVPLPQIPYQSEKLLSYVNRAQNRYKYRDQGIDFNLIRMIRAYYYASISFIDHQIGRIFECLDSIGEIDNTLILFTTDHGEYLGDYNCFGKRGMHDVSARIPLIVSQPGIFDTGRKFETPVSLVDLAPTFLQAAGCLKANNQTIASDGVPLQQVVAGDNERSTVFSHLSFVKQADGTNGSMFQNQDPIPDETRAASSVYMAVCDGFKYIYSALDNKEFFFDRKKDPLETRNRANVSSYQEQVNSMREKTMDHLKNGGETVGMENDSWVVFTPRILPDDPDFGLLSQNQPWVKPD
jgi:arylsulfatase